MSDSTIPEADVAEAKRRAKWLHKYKAPKNWIILTVFEVSTIREEIMTLAHKLDEAREERDQFRSLNESYAACWEEIRAVLGESEQGDKTCDLDRVLKAIRERDEARELLESEKNTRNAIIAKGLKVEKQLREALEYIANAGLSARHIEDYAKEFLSKK